MGEDDTAGFAGVGSGLGSRFFWVFWFFVSAGKKDKYRGWVGRIGLLLLKRWRNNAGRNWVLLGQN